MLVAIGGREGNGQRCRKHYKLNKKIMFCLLFRYFPRGIRTMAKEDWTWYYYYTMKYGFEIVNVLLAIDAHLS